jgi:ABC-type Zn uptake system ZnuABC Zn-binding protein ZnuA
VTRVGGAGLAAAVLLAATTLDLIGCRATAPQETTGLKVAATIQPLASITREILGDRGTVTSLLPPGASPHTFEPLPGDLARLEGTVLLVRIGVGLDQWSERLLAAAGTPPATVTFLDLPDAHPRQWGGDGHGDEEGSSSDAGADPHIWLDPTRVRDALVPALAEALAAADPDGAEAYRERARVFAARLGELDAEIRDRLRGTKTRAFIAYHDTWRYFAERYGLEQVAAIEAYAGDEPTPAELGRLVALARDRQVAAVVMEPQLGERVARNIAAEIGATLELADPLGDPSDPERANYVRTMEFNTRAFARALGGTRP